MTLSPELLALIKDVQPASDEEIAAWFWLGDDADRGTAISLIARIVAERKVVKPLDDDDLVKIMFKTLPSKVYEAMTFERHPPMFPQATYDVPTVEARKFAAALSALEERGS